MLKPFWRKALTHSLIILGVVLLVWFVMPGITFADPPGAPGYESTVTPSPGQVSGVGEMYWFNRIVTAGFGALTGIFGWVFDIAISNFILSFGDQYNNSSLGSVIQSIWSTIRDIFNLAFIFGLIYIGFQIILGINDSQAKRTIGWLILAALLVNFSLFITKFVVDFSNIAAVEVYDLFQSADHTNADGDAAALLSGVSISRAFVNAMELSQVFDGIPGSPIVYTLSVLIISLVLMYVFLAGAVLIAIRFAALSMYMIFSPLMFLGWVFPNFSGTSKKYWQGFLGQAFFAPAYIFMLYLSYQILATFNDPQTRGNLGNLRQTDTTGWDTVTAYGEVFAFVTLAVVFLVASMVVAKKMGAAGANSTISMGNSMRKGLQGGITSFAGRQTIGRAAEWSYKTGEKLERSTAGRFTQGVMTYGSLGLLNKRTRREIYNAGKKAKFGGSYSRADDVAFVKEIETIRGDQKDKKDNTSTIKAGLAELNKPEADRNWETISKMTASLSKMSLGDFEKLSSDSQKGAAPYLTQSFMDKVGDSKEIKDEVKSAMKDARRAIIQSQLNMAKEGGEILTAELTKLTIEQLEEMGEEFILKYVDLLSSSQMDDLKKSKKFSEFQRNRFASVRTARHTGKGTSKTEMKALFKQSKLVAGEIEYTNRKASEIAGYGRDVLMNDEALTFLNVDVLEAIADKKTLSASDRKILGAKIMALTDNDDRVNNMKDWLRSVNGQRTWGGV